MREHIVAIHQPNFFPWLGYFDKIRRAHTFILLDDVQFPKTGGAWMNRVNILQNHAAHWLTAPIDRGYSGVRTINHMQFVTTEWRTNLRSQLHVAYHKAPYYDASMAYIEPLLMNDEANLARYNCHVITALCTLLHLNDTRLCLSSTLDVTASSTERLIALTRSVSGTHYLCGGGAEAYQKDDAFAQAGIALTYQSFTPTAYPQHKNDGFIAGLSVIDPLMQLGVDGTRHLIHGEVYRA